jgi:hypothetical protein
VQNKYMKAWASSKKTIDWKLKKHIRIEIFLYMTTFEPPL